MCLAEPTRQARNDRYILSSAELRLQSITPVQCCITDLEVCDLPSALTTQRSSWRPITAGLAAIIACRRGASAPTHPLFPPTDFIPNNCKPKCPPSHPPK